MACNLMLTVTLLLLLPRAAQRNQEWAPLHTVARLDLWSLLFPSEEHPI